MRWAIIDDGVNLAIPEIVQNIEIDRLGAVKDRTPALVVNHATTCFRIIQNYAHTLFDAVSIKILDDDTRRANKDALIAAFHWCMENDVRLIHMSIGTTEPRDCEAIREMIGKLTARGILIVAANSNRGVQTYPAYDSRVIGVECDNILEGSQFIYTPNALNGLRFRASARHRLQGSKCRTTSLSNSYAAPLITAQLLILAEHEKRLTYDRAMEWLRENAVCTDESIFFSVPREQERAVVIAFLGLDRLKTKQWMTEWKSLFVRDGYACVLAAPADFSLQEAEVIPTGLPMKCYLYWAARFFSCEVVLVSLKEDDTSGVERLVDLLITDEMDKIPPNRYETVICTKSEDAVRSAGELYNDIITILTEEETSMEIVENCIDRTVWSEK